MKYRFVIIVFSINVICQGVFAQKENNEQDSVFYFQKPIQKTIEYNLNISSKDIPDIDSSCCKNKMASDNFFSILYSVTDTLYPLNKRYTDQHGQNLEGTFISFADKRLDEIGISKYHGVPFPFLETKYSGCFQDGIPCCMWLFYIYEKPSMKFTTVIANFENGVFHGKYKVSTSTGFVYETIFDKGSGYYLDVYPDGVVRIEGMLKEGKMEGKWIFKIKKSGKRKPMYKKITTMYINGKVQN